MASKGKRPMRALTPGDKIEAIQRVNDGESKASVARDIGVPESTLRGWCKNEDKLRYMSSRLSSPDTDKSNDGEPPDKRARTESPVAPASPAAGLDLSAAPPAPPPPPPAEPVELTTRRAPSPPAPPPARRADPPGGASVSMSAISPLSGLAHLPGLTHSHLGLSFNEIATNLTLLAQLNPGLSALSAQPASRALRSVRSPKPAHNGTLGVSESKHRSKSHHHSDHYRLGSKSTHHGSSAPAASQPVDETLWYWLKTQQAMLDLQAQTTAAHPLQLGKNPEPSAPPKPVAPAPPVSAHLDYNRNSWLWQYYKQFGGAVPLPDDKHKSAAQVPKDKNAENILYSHLTKRKVDEDPMRPSPAPAVAQPQELRAYTAEPRAYTAEPRACTAEPRAYTAEPRAYTAEPRACTAEPRALEPPASPDTACENKEPAADRADPARTQTKARNVLDNLLFHNGNDGAGDEVRAGIESGGEWEAGAREALEHGDKFLAWLEASGDPSVTRMHVHQLRALLHNLRARRPPALHTARK